MIPTLLTASFIVFAFGSGILALAVARAPFAFEDDDGFHEEGSPGSPMGVVVAFAEPELACVRASAESGSRR